MDNSSTELTHRKGRLVVAHPSFRTVNLADAVDEFLDQCRGHATSGSLAVRTVDNYARDLTEFVEIIGPDLLLDTINGQAIDQAILTFGSRPDRRFTDPSRKTGTGRSAATQRRFRQSISRFFTWATRHSLVQANPMQWSEINPKDRGTTLRVGRRSLTTAQAEALLETGPGDPSTSKRSDQRMWLRDRLILGLLAQLGPRNSELCAANDADFAFDDETLYWTVRGKGGKTRDLPLNDELVQYMREYLEARPAPAAAPAHVHEDAERALLRTWRGRRITPRDVQLLTHRAAERVRETDPQGTKHLARDVTPHALRHTTATVMLAHGENVSVVQRLLGHASLATTGKYLDELPQALARAIADHPLRRTR